MSLAPFEFLFFERGKEASNDVTTFWTWDLSLNRDQLFFEKILHVNPFMPSVPYIGHQHHQN